MSWWVIAKKDVADAARARVLWLVIAVFVVTMAAAAYVPSVVIGEALTAERAVSFLGGPASTVVPITALIAGHLAVAGERESGSLKILLGLPHTRAAVVFGKLVGRAAVVTVGVVAGFAGAALVLAAAYGTHPPVDEYLAYLLLTALFGAAYTGIAVGISAAVRTRAQAVAAAVGVFVVFEFLWGVVPDGIYYLFRGSLPGPGAARPEWYHVLHGLDPNTAYSVLGTRLLPSPGAGIVISDGAAANTAPGAAATVGVSAASTGAIDDGLALTILLAWAVLPVAVGYLWFRRVDLS